MKACSTPPTKSASYQIVAVSDVYGPHRDAVKERSNGTRHHASRLSRGAGDKISTR